LKGLYLSVFHDDDDDDRTMYFVKEAKDSAKETLFESRNVVDGTLLNDLKRFLVVVYKRCKVGPEDTEYLNNVKSLNTRIAIPDKVERVLRMLRRCYSKFLGDLVKELLQVKSSEKFSLSPRNRIVNIEINDDNVYVRHNFIHIIGDTKNPFVQYKWFLELRIPGDMGKGIKSATVPTMIFATGDYSGRIDDESAIAESPSFGYEIGAAQGTWYKVKAFIKPIKDE